MSKLLKEDRFLFCTKKFSDCLAIVKIFVTFYVVTVYSKSFDFPLVLNNKVKKTSLVRDTLSAVVYSMNNV